MTGKSPQGFPGTDHGKAVLGSDSTGGSQVRRAQGHFDGPEVTVTFQTLPQGSRGFMPLSEGFFTPCFFT